MLSQEISQKTIENIINNLNKLAKLSKFAGENPFKSKAYTNAAEAIATTNNLTIADILSLPGIGSSIASKIVEMLETGTCAKLEDLNHKFGHLLNLLDIPGIGHIMALKLYSEYNVTDAKGVKTLIESGLIKNKRIAEGVNVALSGRIPLDKAQEISTNVINNLRRLLGDKLINIVVCGSIRRKKTTVGDIDIVIHTKERAAVAESLYIVLDAVMDNGSEKIGGIVNGCRIQVRFATDNDFGAMTLHFTGPTSWNVKCRLKAQLMGYRLNEYGLWKNSEHIAGKTEEEILSVLNIEYKNPTERE